MRALSLSPHLEQAALALRDSPHVMDIRNIGLVAGIELSPRPGATGARAAEAFEKWFDRGELIRYTADTIAISPPLIVKEDQKDHIFNTRATGMKTSE